MALGHGCPQRSGVEPDGWLAGKLLAQSQRLVERLEGLGGSTVEEQSALADLEAPGAELDVRPAVAQREQFVAETPKVDAAFAFLEHHWSYLVNRIESHPIPRTNNAAEEVIRIFNTTKPFAALRTSRKLAFTWASSRRFTASHLSQDAQQRIRGKCALELASYEA